jgi:galactokinase
MAGNAATVVVRAPGRVNLIGDHTDHTGGRCLPIAIDRWVEVAGRTEPAGDRVRLTSEALRSTVDVPLDGGEPATTEPEWGRYVAAIVKRTRPPSGFAGTVRSTLPIGSGLSSSAALEVATALALTGGGGAPGPPDLSEPADRLALARLCSDAEHEARDVPTGLLDQIASIYGVAGHGLLLDCTSLEVVPVPLPPDDEVEWVVVDSGARSLGRSAYGVRVGECRRAEAEIGPLGAARPEDCAAIADPAVRSRAVHVVSENRRVLDFAAALRAGDLAEAGRLMDESHRSLSTDYESSTPEVDALCAELRAQPGVLGARITGGGWGGCVVAMVRPGALPLPDRAWRVRPSAGATVTTTAH